MVTSTSGSVSTNASAATGSLTPSSRQRSSILRTASTTSGMAGRYMYSGFSRPAPVARMLPPNGAGTMVPMFFALAAASSPVSLAAVLSNVYRRGICSTSNSPVSTAFHRGPMVPVAMPIDWTSPSDCSFLRPSSAPPGPRTSAISSSSRGSWISSNGSFCSRKPRRLFSALRRK